MKSHIKRDVIHFISGSIIGFIIFILIRAMELYFLGAPKGAPPNMYNHIYSLLFSKLSEFAFKISGENLRIAHYVFLINIVLFMFVCGGIFIIIRNLFCPVSTEMLPEPEKNAPLPAPDDKSSPK